MTHDPTCSGCEQCNPALHAFTAGDYTTYCRIMATRDEKMRANIHQESSTMHDDTENYEPPNGYAHDAKQLRAAAAAAPEPLYPDAASRFAALDAEHQKFDAEIAAMRFTTAQDAESYAPPDAYARDLAAMKEARR